MVVVVCLLGRPTLSSKCGLSAVARPALRVLTRVDLLVSFIHSLHFSRPQLEDFNTRHASASGLVTHDKAGNAVVSSPPVVGIDGAMVMLTVMSGEVVRLAAVVAVPLSSLRLLATLLTCLVVACHCVVISISSLVLGTSAFAVDVTLPTNVVIPGVVGANDDSFACRVSKVVLDAFAWPVEILAADWLVLSVTGTAVTVAAFGRVPLFAKIESEATVVSIGDENDVCCDVVSIGELLVLLV